MAHKPVLLNEVIKKMLIKKDGIYVDATLGFGGHAKAISKELVDGKLIVFDQDKETLELTKNNLKSLKNIFYINDNFKNLKEKLKELNIEKIDGIIYDLGTSYFQLTDENRGFSYHGDQRLDMRMDRSQEIDAVNILNNYSEVQLKKIFFEYGDEKKSFLLAKKIVEKRKLKPITRNTELNEIIKEVKGYNKLKHPSKNIFQAIRIEVNNEIDCLKKSLDDALSLLRKDGILLVITFHSLEDRVVKQVFRKYKEEKTVTVKEDIYKFKTFKNIFPSKQEVEDNLASRSAKLRSIQKKYE